MAVILMEVMEVIPMGATAATPTVVIRKPVMPVHQHQLTLRRLQNRQLQHRHIQHTMDIDQ